jgi:hypothetical protein
VYRVNGHYVLDNVSRGLDDDQVVRATHVTEVDLSRNAPVAVQFDINSKDHAVFTVVVTFECTVVDPVLVVQEGITRPDKLLLNYLRSHHNASQMGLDFTLSEIHDVRRYIDAQLTAYRTHVPPQIPGFEVRMASVEVRTPHEEAEDADARRTMTRQHNLAKDRLGLDHDLDKVQSRYTHDQQRRRVDQETDLKIQRTQNEHLVGREQLDRYTDLEAARIRSDHLLGSSKLDSDHIIDRQRREHEQQARLTQQAHEDELRLMAQRAELGRHDEIEEYRFRRLTQATEMIGSDPDRALMFAYLAGKLEPSELADRFRGDRDEARDYVRAEADKDREERRLAQREDHEQQLRALQYQREETVAKLTAEREDLAWQRDEARRDAERERFREAQRFELERAEREHELAEAKERRQWERQDRINSERIAAEVTRRREDGQLQVVRDLIQRGLLDASSINLEQLVAKLGGNGVEEILQPEELPTNAGEIPSGEDRRDADRQDQNDDD